jgi:hypothetical protein
MGIFDRLFSKRTSYRTPYDEIGEIIQRKEKQGEPVGKVYDSFISYKVQDVGIVRPIAEQMIAGGLKVWFAEYTILLSDRDKFEQFYTMGAQQAKFGVCFTNKRYIQSNACRKELKLLLENCGAHNVIEIRLPAMPLSHRIPQLAKSPSIAYEDMNQALRFIREISRLPIELMEPAESSPHTPSVFHYDGRDFSLDLTGWNVNHQKTSVPDKEGDVRGPDFRRWCGQDLMWGHVLVGKQDKHIRRKNLSQASNGDWQYYEEAIDFARIFYGKHWKQKCVGVHALFRDDLDFRHNAFTTKFGPGTWARLYSVVLPDPNSHQDIEFAFFFFFRGKFTEFCRYAHYMDKVVQSLEPV